MVCSVLQGERKSKRGGERKRERGRKREGEGKGKRELLVKISLF